ncbi:MAG: sugar phosphate nucleotidyltransferase [Firmicutes bacterium]|nr:sugar phosphate nucleotidyltransferase [Bacillota bacterium]
MKIVLLSGGSGKRLWPLSNDARSKQFLKVLQGAEGKPVSMVQRVWGQLEALGLARDTYICTSKAQVDIIESQLGEVPVIVEPHRRDTFAAIALACAYLLDETGADENDIVVVLPVDQYVEDTYFETVMSLAPALESTGADIALLGVQPTVPTSKYGYLQIGEALQGEMEVAATVASSGVVERASGVVLPVSSFVEKPPLQEAERLIEGGALWNCGVFCFRLGYLKSVLSDRQWPTTYEGLMNGYHELPQISFDYEVVERARSVVAVSYAGQWKDLGTWETLSQEMTSDFSGRGTALACDETQVINELGIPVIALGLQRTVVVASPDGVLVAEKGYTTALKDIVKPFSGRPMYEERFWGSYRVLDYTQLADGTEVLVRTVEILPGKNLSYQQHARRTELWTVIEGTGELALGHRMTQLQAGDVVQVFAGQWHAVCAHDRLVFVEVQRGHSLDEEDIVRRYERWSDIVSHCAVLA